MVEIHDSTDKVIRKSRNLRGLLEYARHHVITRLSIHGREDHAVLYVGFDNGAWTQTRFADYRRTDSYTLLFKVIPTGKVTAYRQKT